MQRAIFTPKGSTDPAVLAGEGEVEVVRPLTADEADLDDVGPMFEVRNLATNAVTDAFADELFILN